MYSLQYFIEALQIHSFIIFLILKVKPKDDNHNEKKSYY